MDQIKHSYVQVNGLKLHVAEIGSDSSPAVIFLHGFPEIWYTWRHQMIAVAKAGFRAIAPDYRGYGLSDIPQQPEKTSFLDLVNDTASILVSLNISKVYVIGKDFGAMVAYTFALFHPEKVAGVITLGVPFRPPGSHKSHQVLPEGFYIRRWQEPGRAEADFGQFDAKTVVRNIYIMFSRSEIPIAAENQEIMDLVDPSDQLPSWFTEDDLAVYGELYHKSGFQTALQVPYRSFKEKIEFPKQGPNDLKVEAPALFIMGEKDYVFKFPGTEEYLKSGEVKKYVPNLEIVYLPEGCHFVHEQFPDQSLSVRIMEQIKHSYVEVNGLKLHVAETGSDSSPAVIFLHGFPEIWYTWRHQMIAVANAGFRAIAPDYRGYGLSDLPQQPENTSFLDLVNDTASILDSLSISKVFVIGKDFGAMVAYTFSLIHPEKVAGVVTLGVPFMPPGFFKSHQALPEGFYMKRWQEPGRAEADFGRFDAKMVVRNIYIMFSRSEIPIASENQEIMDLVDPSAPLPSWFTEEDLSEYGDLYQKCGFKTPLQVPYRSFAEKTGSTQQGVNDPKVEVTALLIMGEEDYVLKFPGMEEYLKSGEVKKYVPNLEIVYLPQGCHFVHEQFPDQVNQLILDFLTRNKY